jgi:hypothetical protein
LGAGLLSMLAVLPLAFAADQARIGGPYVAVIVVINAPLIALLWALPLWALVKRRRPHFAYGWLCTHLCAASFNGLCWGYLYAGRLFR